MQTACMRPGLALSLFFFLFLLLRVVRIRRLDLQLEQAGDVAIRLEREKKRMHGVRRARKERGSNERYRST